MSGGGGSCTASISASPIQEKIQLLLLWSTQQTPRTVSVSSELPPGQGYGCEVVTVTQDLTPVHSWQRVCPLSVRMSGQDLGFQVAAPECGTHPPLSFVLQGEERENSSKAGSGDPRGQPLICLGAVESL